MHMGTYFLYQRRILKPRMVQLLWAGCWGKKKTFVKINSNSGLKATMHLFLSLKFFLNFLRLSKPIYLLL